LLIIIFFICKDSFKKEKLAIEFKKFKKNQQKDPKTANNMTLPLFMDLYKFNHLQQRGHDL